MEQLFEFNLYFEICCLWHVQFCINHLFQSYYPLWLHYLKMPKLQHYLKMIMMQWRFVDALLEVDKGLLLKVVWWCASIWSCSMLCHWLKLLDVGKCSLLEDATTSRHLPIKMCMNAERFVAIDLPMKMHDHVQSYVAINLSFENQANN